MESKYWYVETRFTVCRSGGDELYVDWPSSGSRLWLDSTALCMDSAHTYNMGYNAIQV